MEIREAVLDDAAPLLDHLRALQAEKLEIINPVDPLPSLEEEKGYIRNLTRGGGILFVCECSGAIIGILSCVRMKRRAKPTGNIGMSVTRPHRRKGIGEALLNRLMDEARQQDLFEYLWLEVDSRNLAARKLYEKTGFEYVTSDSSRGILKMEYMMRPGEDRSNDE